MIQAAIASVLLICVYKFMKTNNEYEIDWWMAFVFVLVPVLLIFLISIGLGVLELPQEYALLGYLFYLIVPFSILKFGLDFNASTAMKFSIWVPVAAVIAEIPFVILMGAGNA